MAGLTTALWEKIRHGSLDWYAIGGMFVVTFIVFMFILRKDRKQSGPQTLPVQGTQALELGIPTLSALLGQEPSISFDPKAFFAQVYYSPITAEFEKNIKLIAQKHAPADKEGFYARFIGVGAVAYQHDVTWFTIFKSQLSPMAELNARGLIPLADVKKHYDKAAVNYPPTYANYSFDQWMTYLLSRQLIAKHPSDMVELSHGGKDFLRYVAHSGWNTNAKAN